MTGFFLVPFVSIWIYLWQTRPGMKWPSRFRMVAMLAGACLLWTADYFWVLWLGWSLLTLPLWAVFRQRKPSAAVLVSLLALHGAFGWAAVDGGSVTLWANLHDTQYADWESHHIPLLLWIATWSAGLFPFHSWRIGLRTVFAPHEQLVFDLSFGGVAVFVKLLDTLHHRVPEWGLLLLVGALVVHGVFHAFRALRASDPVDVLRSLRWSQGGLLLASLLSSDTGEAALRFLLPGLMVSFGILLDVLYFLKRNYELEGGCDRYHGLALTHPNAHRLFLLAGLCLIGVPGSLCFVGEDLVFHSLLELSSLACVGFIAATAVNAMAYYRVYTRLFHGFPLEDFPADGLDFPAARTLVLTLGLLFLFAGGIFPSWLLGRG